MALRIRHTAFRGHVKSLQIHQECFSQYTCLVNIVLLKNTTFVRIHTQNQSRHVQFVQPVSKE